MAGGGVVNPPPEPNPTPNPWDLIRVVRRGWRADIERSLIECGLAPGSVLWWAFEIERVRRVPRVPQEPAAKTEAA